jgi:hypothetical protein
MKKIVPLALLASGVIIVVLVSYFGLAIIPKSPWRYADEIIITPLSYHKLTARADGLLEMNISMPDGTEEELRPDVQIDEEGRLVIIVDLAFDILPDEASINAEKRDDNGEILPRVSIVVTSDSHYNVPEYIDSGESDDPETEDTDESKLPNPDYMEHYYTTEIAETHLYIKIMATGLYTVQINVRENGGAAKTVLIYVWEKDWYDEHFGGGGMG